MYFRQFIAEAKMDNEEVVSVCNKLLSNSDDEKVKKFAQGLLDFYKENDSFTPDQVAGLQNIMKNASFNLAESDLKKEYQDYFQGLLNKYNVDSPAEMDEETMKKFFDEVHSGWIKGKGEK